MMLRSMQSRIEPIRPELTRIDNACYDRFHAAWWDPLGPVQGLHSINPTRCDYIDRVFRASLGLERTAGGWFVDIGCGGGLVTEELARRGYPITGVDISLPSLEAARNHAAAAGVQVTYHYGSAYALEVDSGTVDGVIMCDVLEHLHDLPRAISEGARVLRPGGVLVFDTINRTLKSYVLMILLAQEIFKVAAPKTHDWQLFIAPEELRTLLARHGLAIRQLAGLTPRQSIPRMIGNILQHKSIGEFGISDDLSVLYFGYAINTAAADDSKEAEPASSHR
jgi:2-polyprenyl-6-hydroxyphenyl methylase/3-demethylubiquinone-9 3-methyltransferase